MLMLAFAVYRFPVYKLPVQPAHTFGVIPRYPLDTPVDSSPLPRAQISYWGILIFWQIPLCQLGDYRSYVEQITNEITVSKYKPA